MSVTKRIGQIVTAIRVDGLAGARRAMSSMARGAGDVGKAVDKLDGKSAASVAAGAEIASDSLREVAQAAKVAERAVEGIGDVQLDPQVSGFGKLLSSRMSAEAKIAGRQVSRIYDEYGGLSVERLDAEEKSARNGQLRSDQARKARLIAAKRSVDATINELDALDRDAGGRRAAQRIDVSGIDPSVAKRAVRAYKDSLGKGVELEFYIDEAKSVRLVRDQLRALERRTGKLNIDAFDSGAVERAAESLKEAFDQGASITEFLDDPTGTIFDAEQLEEIASKFLDADSSVAEALAESVDATSERIRGLAEKLTGKSAAEAGAGADQVEDIARAAGRAEDSLAGAGNETRRLTAAEIRAAREAIRAARAAANIPPPLNAAQRLANLAQRGLVGMGTAGYAAARRITAGIRPMARLLRQTSELTAKLTASLTAAAGVKLGGAAAFAVKAGQDTVERYKQARNVSSLTGMTVQEVELWERFGASVGLEGTDLGQVFSGFTAAMRDAQKGGNETAEIFDKLGLSIDGASKAGTQGIEGLMPGVKSLWPSLDKGAASSQKSFKKTNTAFLDFLKNVNKLSREERGQILTQVFGEDDALKVAELADQVAASGGDIRSSFGQGLVSQKELGRIKRYQTAIIQLGITWNNFKRQLFTTLEPMMTFWSRFLGDRIVRSSRTIIQDYFVRPLSAASRTATKFIRFMDANDGWKRVNAAIQTTFVAVAKLLGTVGELGKMFYRAFGRDRSLEATYSNIIAAIISGLKAIDRWAADGRGERALLAFAEAGRGVWNVFKAMLSVVAAFGLAIDDVLKKNGVDLGKIFTVANLRDVFVGAIEWVAAFFRDMAKIFNGQFDMLETDLAKRLVVFGALVVLAAIGIQDQLKGVVNAFVDHIKARIKSLVDYLKVAWNEAVSAGGGKGLDGITTALGFLLYAVMQAVDWLERLTKAFRDVFVLQKEAPEGFRWLQDVKEIFGQLWTAVKNVHRALQPIISAIDSVLARLGDWNTATVLLVTLIGVKLFGAFKSLLGVLGVSAAAGGGGILGAIATIGSRILALAAGPVGALIAAFGLVATAVSVISDRFDALREKRMELARQQMDRDFEKYGAKNGLSVAENDARRAALKSVNPASYGSVYGGVNRQVVYTPEDDFATIEAKMLGRLPTQKLLITAGDTVIETMQTESQAAALRRSRSLSLGN